MGYRTPTILIVNVHSSLNAGDLALLECTIQQLNENFPGAHFIVSSNWPDEPYFRRQNFETLPSAWTLSGVNSNQPIGKQILLSMYGRAQGWISSEFSSSQIRFSGGWANLLNAYKRSDLVVGVAGNQFYSTGRFGWPFPVTAISVALALDYKKPFYTMPQTIGPLRRGWERTTLKRLYGNSRMIFLRDKSSLSLAREIGIPEEKIHYAPDIAFNFKPVDKWSALGILQKFGFKAGTPAIGATIIASMGRSLDSGVISNYYHAIADGLCKFLDQHPMEIFLFNQVVGPTSVEKDQLGAEKVIAEMGDLANKVHLVSDPLSPAELKACYGWMDMFIPTRLHSGIFALSMGVPSLFIGYLTKTRGILEKIGLEEWTIDISQLTGEKFLEKLTALWDNKTAYSELLQNLLPKIIDDSKLPGALIAKDFAEYEKL
jgi:polysaccharide pyruvyl transferase WcaK-like protein